MKYEGITLCHGKTKFWSCKIKLIRLYAWTLKFSCTTLYLCKKYFRRRIYSSSECWTTSWVYSLDLLAWLNISAQSAASGVASLWVVCARGSFARSLGRGLLSRSRSRSALNRNCHPSAAFFFLLRLNPFDASWLAIKSHIAHIHHIAILREREMSRSARWPC